MTDKQYIKELLRLTSYWRDDIGMCECSCEDCSINRKIELVGGGEIRICDLFVSVLNNESILGLEE